MKVSAGSAQINSQAKPKKLSPEELRERVSAKFGEKAQLVKPQPKPPVDTAEVKTKGVKNSTEEDFGDIAKNDPKSEVTQEKLKTILKNGGFNFNDRERQALSEILK